MFVYYGYLFPLSTRIQRGFYQDGVWSDSGFMPWSQISAVSWKDESMVTLILISHGQSLARRLDVPGLVMARPGGCCWTASKPTTSTWAGPDSTWAPGTRAILFEVHAGTP